MQEVWEVVWRLERLVVAEGVVVSMERGRGGGDGIGWESGMVELLEARRGWRGCLDELDLGWNVLGRLWRFEGEYAL